MNRYDNSKFFWKKHFLSIMTQVKKKRKSFRLNIRTIVKTGATSILHRKKCGLVEKYIFTETTNLTEPNHYILRD